MLEMSGIIHKESRTSWNGIVLSESPSMAGSEKDQFEASSDRLIEMLYYYSGRWSCTGTPTDFTEMISSLGTIPMVLTSEEHDFITGVSHLPHIAALVNLVNMLDSDQNTWKRLQPEVSVISHVLLLLLQLCGSSLCENNQKYLQCSGWLHPPAGSDQMFCE